jgi:hypothetical protein
MGPLLLRRGRITLRQLATAAGMVCPGKRLGAVLVEQGVLGPRDLIAAVVEHTQEIVYGAFQWTEGHYRRQEGAPPPETITLKLSTPEIILEGIRRIESWARIDAVYERVPGSEATLAAMRMPEEKAAVLRRLTAPMAVDALSGDPALPDFELCRTLWAFRVIGLVRRVDAAAVPGEVEDESLGIVVPEE